MPTSVHDTSIIVFYIIIIIITGIAVVIVELKSYVPIAQTPVLAQLLLIRYVCVNIFFIQPT